MGGGAPLVFLHGGLLDSRMWEDQVSFFRTVFRTIRYDARGYGPSERTPGVFGPHEDLHGLLKVVNAEPAFLVGQSLGARTAVSFALEHPSAVRALVLVSIRKPSPECEESCSTK
jgi:3-oxoadipate enol-lactonase